MARSSITLTKSHARRSNWIDNRCLPFVEALESRRLLSVTGLIGEWKFTDSAGNASLHNSNTAEADATFNGDAAFTRGRFGYGVTLDGTGDYVIVPASLTYNLSGSNGMTVSMWVYLPVAPVGTSTEQALLVRPWDSSAGAPYYQYGVTYKRGVTNNLDDPSQDKFNFYLGPAGGGSTPASFSIAAGSKRGVWNNVTFVYDATGGTPAVRAYLNGNWAGVTTSSTIPTSLGGSTTLSAQVRLGGSQNYPAPYTLGKFAGKIDDARIYNRPLSVDEIRQDTGQELDSSRGAYVIFNDLANKIDLTSEGTGANKDYYDLLNNATNSTALSKLEGINLKIAWNWIEPTDGVYDWTYVNNQIKAITDNLGGKDGRLKLYLFVNVEGQAPSWIYNGTHNVQKFYYKDGVGGTSYQDAEMAIPWSGDYQTLVTSLITSLKNDLQSLSANEYGAITQVGISGAAGVKDEMYLPTGTDDQALPGALETRTEPVARYNQAYGTNVTSFYHNYENEWVLNAFTVNHPYVITNGAIAGNPLATAQIAINDAMANAFDDKVVVRTSYLSDPAGAAGAVDADTLKLWPNLLNDALYKNPGQYDLQDNAWSAWPDGGRYNDERVLEADRVAQTDASISFEEIAGTASPRFIGTLHDAFVQGLNRGASAFRLYVGDTQQSNSEYTDNMAALDFMNGYFANDTSNPSDITDLSAVAGSASGQIQLTWSAPGDERDGTAPLGAVKGYLLKYSTSPITDATTFNAAATLDTPFVPARVGKAETLTISGLTANQQYYFAVKGIDDKGKISANFTAAGAKAPDATALPAPAAQFRFDENWGPNTAEAISGNTKSVQNKQMWITAKRGSGLHFNGASDNYVGSTTGLDALRGDNASMAFWVRTAIGQVGSNTLGNAPGIIGTAKNAATNNLWGYLDGSGKIGISMGNVGGTHLSVTSAAAINDGNWHYIVLTRELDVGTGYSTLKLYVDGSLSASNQSNSSGVKGTMALNKSIGRVATTSSYNMFQGDLDELQLFDHALTASEIARLAM